MPKSFSAYNYEFQKEQHRADEVFTEILWKFFSSYVLQVFSLPLNHFSLLSPRSLIETLNFLRCSYLWEHALALPRDYARGTQLSL